MAPDVMMAQNKISHFQMPSQWYSSVWHYMLTSWIFRQTRIVISNSQVFISPWASSFVVVIIIVSFCSYVEQRTFMKLFHLVPSKAPIHWIICKKLSLYQQSFSMLIAFSVPSLFHNSIWLPQVTWLKHLAISVQNSLNYTSDAD